MLERIAMIPDHHLIHRDIKPANFVMGVGSVDDANMVRDMNCVLTRISSGVRGRAATCADAADPPSVILTVGSR